MKFEITMVPVKELKQHEGIKYFPHHWMWILELGYRMKRNGIMQIRYVEIDKEKRVIHGLARVNAAKEVGITEVPCLIVSDIGDLQRHYDNANIQENLDRGTIFR